MKTFRILKSSLLAVALALLSAGPLLAQEAGVSAGPAAIDTNAINTKLSDDLVHRLESAEDKDWAAIYKTFTEHPEQYQPFALYAMSRAILKRGDKDESAFWYAVGKIRSSFDAARCADYTAGESLVILEQQYPELSINFKCKYDRFRNSLIKALAWDEKNPYRYDHRWINLLGSGLKTSGSMSLSEATWPQIRQTTREEMVSTVHQLESQGKERWNSTQRGSAQKGVDEYENTLKRAKAENNAELEKLLERLKRTKDALEACLKEG